MKLLKQAYTQEKYLNFEKTYAKDKLTQENTTPTIVISQSYV